MEDKTLECDICRQALHIPVVICNRHTCCYYCAWKTFTLSPSHTDWDSKQIQLHSSCPFCRNNDILVRIDSKVTISGMSLVPDQILKGLFGQQEDKCPFCIFTGPVVDVAIHVQTCLARDFPCAHEQCTARIPMSVGWPNHIVQECKYNRCKQCPFQGTFEEVSWHEKIHTSLIDLRQKCYAWWQFLANYDLEEEKLVAQYGPRIFHERLQDFMSQFKSRDLIFNLFRFDSPSRGPVEPRSSLLA